MATLKISNWESKRAWASENSWDLTAFCDRIESCTNLHGTKLKRIAKAIKSQELLQLDNVKLEKAEPIIHTLESLGAKIEVE